jgi:FkbM family methyltransferase
MEFSFSPSDCYWKYLESVRLNLDSNTLSRLATSLENTSWETPTSAVELNNFAVVALVEAEQCTDLSLREVYLEMAIDALDRGVKLYGDPLCTAHFGLVLAMTGETEQAMQTAFSAFINALQPAYVNQQPIPSGIVYLPPINDFTDKRFENLATILQTEDAYRQSLLLFSEVLCCSHLVFYNAMGLRLLHLAAQLLPQISSINLKLGISSIINNQWEGLLYLYRARQIAPSCASTLQAIYLAYRDLGQIQVANSWLDISKSISDKHPNKVDWKWAELDFNSMFTYIKFENQLLLAVEPSFRSLVTSVLIAEGDWFEKEMEFWRNSIKPGMTVIDVGANVGVYTFSAAQRVGLEGRVLAVEPFSGCIRCLQETCRVNQLSSVKVCAGAASNRIGTAKLTLHAASELNEIVDSDTGEPRDFGTFEEVKCFSLDSLIEQENITQVDFLKIDAEDHEIKVLEGSTQILSKFSPIILYENIAGSKSSNISVADFVKKRGYQLFRYQPYLQQLLPITSTEDLQGRLNLIAVPQSKILQ